jgi:hypothetical protein
MRKALLCGLLGLLTLTTVFVALDKAAPVSQVEEEEYGGPFRRFLQNRKKAFPRKQREVEIIVSPADHIQK